MSKTWYGSITNRINEGVTILTPEVGMGATEYLYSDSSPYTIVEVLSPNKIMVQRDNYRLISGSCMSESQDYEFTRNTETPKQLVTLRKDGLWHLGTTMQGNVFGIGTRIRYYDPSF